MSTPKDINYSDNVNCKFAETVYQQMASKRYGLSFCCETDMDQTNIDKQLLDLNAIMDKQYTIVP